MAQRRKSYTNAQQSSKRALYGKIERHHLESLVDILSKSRPGFKFEFIPSALNKAVCYDGLLHIKNAEGFIVKRIIIEAKVRTKDFQSYFLERQKYENLKKMQKDHPEYLIWYVNFSPVQTYIYDLDKCDLGSVTMIQMNSQTFKSTTNKVDKPVFDVNVSQASTIKYSHSINPYNK